jgi:hypothetical protein
VTGSSFRVRRMSLIKCQQSPRKIATAVPMFSFSSRLLAPLQIDSKEQQKFELEEPELVPCLAHASHLTWHG